MVRASFLTLVATAAGVQNHEWDCNCQGLYDVCSYTTCTYTTQCGGAAVKSWPNVHNLTEGVGDGSNPWHCNCAGTYSWCSYTTCYAHCDAEEEDQNLLVLPEPVEEKAPEVLEKAANLNAQNHEWDCNCQGLYDVCSFTTCTYSTQCAHAAVKSWPNIHNVTEGVGDGSNPWHCNCAGTYSWCSYTTCYAHCDAEAEDQNLLALPKPEEKASEVLEAASKLNLNVENHEWDCNCQGLYDVCSFTTCTYSTQCAHVAVKSWPNIHNLTEGVGDGSNPWHCNCAGTYSWCSYTTCYAHCDAEEEDQNLLALPKPVEEKAEVLDKAANLNAQNHEWDCNCQGLYDVCSYTTCTYSTQCAHAAVKSWPNIHNVTEGVGDGSNPWHCNCAGTYSWCSYTTCYAHCDAEVEDQKVLALPTPVENAPEAVEKVEAEVQNHEWDCNCQGLYDVCSYTTCTYTTQCGGAAAKSWPNIHNLTEGVGDGSNPWHCNCAGTYSWCSYTTCYAHCNAEEVADTTSFVV